MTWLKRISAFTAALRRRVASSNPASAGTAPTTGASGHANPVFHSQRSGGERTSAYPALIARRAQRMFNRDRKAASAFEAKHMMLARGIER